MAAKQLHALTEDPLMREGVNDMLREMSVLSELRHPNLVLFLGVTYDPSTHTPRSILTELLPHSLYDLLESKHIQFEPVEALGVGEGILHALTYLHSRDPAVVHRSTLLTLPSGLMLM